MKIASFCFHTGREQVGGAQVPAVAFKKWANIFGIECDLVTNSKDVSPDIPCDVFYIPNEEQLNEYDAVFFSTPDHFGGSDFDYSKVTVKKAVMCHAEFDHRLYGGPARFQEAMLSADMQIVIGACHWGFAPEKEFVWYPCTLPEYLIDGEEKFDERKFGLLYAARISAWKNAHLLAMLTRCPSFLESMWGRVNVCGNANANDYCEMVYSIKPQWTVASNIFSIYDFEKIKERNSKYRYFWDVSGNDEYRFSLKRFNLSAVEAMKFGCVPIAHGDSLPIPLQGIHVEIRDLLANPKLADKFDPIQQANHMRDTIMDSRMYSYHAVRLQMAKIFGELLT